MTITDTPSTDPITDPTRFESARASAQRFRRQQQEGEEHFLPYSQTPVRLGHPSTLAMAATPHGLPNPISVQARRLIRDGNGLRFGATEEEKDDTFQQNAQAFIEIGALVMLAPTIVYGWTCSACGRLVKLVDQPQTPCTCVAPDQGDAPTWAARQPNYDAGEISYQDVPGGDYLYMYTWVTSPAVDAATFLGTFLDARAGGAQ